MQFEKSVFFKRVVHQLFKSNLTFCVVCVFDLQFEKSVFLREWFVHNRLVNANFDGNKKNTYTLLLIKAIRQMNNYFSNFSLVGVFL
jgi:hypothetical protein